MKNLILFVTFIAGYTLTMPRNLASEPVDDVDPLWKAVQKALDEGRPQTALERLNPIAQRAEESGNVPEKIRVLVTRIHLETQTSEGTPDSHLKKLRAAIDVAEPKAKPVLEAIQATWMWGFFQQHRWQFAQRTTVAQVAAPKDELDSPQSEQIVPSPDDDLMTWDLQRILSAIDDQFQRSFQAAQSLKSVPIDTYKMLLTLGNVPASYRPTMYDVLAHHALEFYSAGEQAGSRSIGAFELAADSPIFGPLDDFLAWKPDSADARAPQIRAIKIFQELLRFHQSDDDPTARLDLDRLRTQYGYNHAVGDEKVARYKAALEQLVAANASHPVAAAASANLVDLLIEANDYVAALQIAEKTLDRFPDSLGGHRCFNAIQSQIKNRETRISTERVWNDPWPTIDVHYRNITKVYFRLVRFNFEDFATSQRWRPENLDDAQTKKLLSSEPVKSWSVDLPSTDDFRWRVENLTVPTDVPVGSYYLLGCTQADFAQGGKGEVFSSEVWVSKLALVTRTTGNDGIIAGHVLDAKTGKPIAGATVQAWQQNQDSPRRTVNASVRTDKDGQFQFPAANRGQVLLLATNGKDQLSTNDFLSSGIYHQPPQNIQVTQFFTDRAIYRPGQTIRYKGIAYYYDQDKDRYEVLPQQSLTIAMFDANGQEIERLEHRTNQYGSFSGSLTAPKGRLMGNMSINVTRGPQGNAQIRVEEYKRPKFEVKLEPPQDAARLGEPVEVHGQATAYTGATVGGATVQWRVVREVRFPPWWYWRMWWLPPVDGASQEIGHGTTTTDVDGKFHVNFKAKPDLSVDKKSDPKFRFTVYADVTDGTGETRSAERSVSAGYTALEVSISTANAEWLTTEKPVEISIRTTDLDDTPQAAEGVIKVHALEQPEKVIRPKLSDDHWQPINPLAKKDEPPKDPGNPASWPLGEVVFESAFKTDATGAQTLATKKLPAGIYRVTLATKDRFGQDVTTELPLEVYDVDAPAWPVKLPNRLVFQKTSLEPGQTLQGLWTSGYSEAQALIEIEHRGKMIQRYWTPNDRTQVKIELPITEEMRGGVTVHTTFVHENRAYLQSQRIEVPWTNKKLEITWERFVSKLGPSQKETWTAVIKGHDAERAAAEMVATLYDASLDTFTPHEWLSGFPAFRQDYSHLNRSFANLAKGLLSFGRIPVDFRDITWQYPVLNFPHAGYAKYGHRFGGGRMMRGQMLEMAPAAPAAMADGAVTVADTLSEGMAMQKASGGRPGGGEGEGPGEPGQSKQVSLEGIPVRTNLNETAFFFPHVLSSEDGVVKLEFTMPEALTRWRFMGFAHDQKLRGGLLSDTAVTSKDLMIQPNPPRFLREGDVLEMTVKVTNLSATRQTGSAALNFFEPNSGESLDAAFENSSGQQSFDLEAGGTKSLAWRIKVPDGVSLVTYRAVASSGRLTDGEEGYLPVLSRRILVTESLALPIRGKQTKEVNFQRLIDSASSDTLAHQSLTVQMASNPAWYAVMSLPYLMEYPHQCNEQIFNRLYANSLARHIATSDPKIERVFQQWRGTETLDSPLTKNQDLKSTVLEESPWVQEAQSESQSRRNVGILFDQNRLNDEIARALAEINERQLGDGRWSWFPGGPPSDYITLYLTTGYGRLRHLGVDIDLSAAIRALGSLDAWMAEQHRLALELDKQARSRAEELGKPISNDELPSHLNYTLAMYLYGRSFYLPENPIAAEHQAALQFWLNQAKEHWLELGSLQSQAHVALALKRFGDRETATQIMVSLKERSLENEEMGTYWKTGAESYWWYHAPIETQAALIEAFDEVAGDAAMVEGAKVWLLKQKQTQNWKSTKATADAVYALLLRGTDVLASDRLVEVKLAGEAVKPESVEAGTGYYEQRRSASEVKPELGHVAVKKLDDGVAWGSLHWQYFEDIDRVTASADSPLSISKELFVKRNTDNGPQLVPVGKVEGDHKLRVGDELVVRLVLKVDRDMEYIHLKDHRGSGTEPTNVLSGYRYQDGLGYYESIRDTASHFFMDYLRKGTYVFEYSTRIQLRGSYQTGMASIQCMYAPEFNSHSQSIRLEVGQ